MKRLALALVLCFAASAALAGNIGRSMVTFSEPPPPTQAQWAYPGPVGLINMTGAPKSNFNNTTWWTPTNVQDTTFSTTTTAPDSISNAQKFIANSTNSSHGLTTAIGPVLNTTSTGQVTYRFAVDAAAAGLTRIQVVLSDQGNSGFGFATFDLAGGQVGIAPATSGSFTGTVSASIVNIGIKNGVQFYRCILDVGYTTQTTSQWAIFLDGGSGTGASNTTFAGNGVNGVWMWQVSVLPKGAWNMPNLNFNWSPTGITTDVDVNNTRQPGYTWYTSYWSNSGTCANPNCSPSQSPAPTYSNGVLTFQAGFGQLNTAAFNGVYISSATIAQNILTVNSLCTNCQGASTIVPGQIIVSAGAGTIAPNSVVQPYGTNGTTGTGGTGTYALSQASTVSVAQKMLGEAYIGQFFTAGWYIEATFSWNPALAPAGQTVGWPGFFLQDKFVQSSQDFANGGYEATSTGIEIDGFEGLPSGTAGAPFYNFNTHDWVTSSSQAGNGIGTRVDWTFSQSAASLGSPTFTNQNRYGTLWIPIVQNDNVNGVMMRFFNGLYISGNEIVYNATTTGTPAVSSGTAYTGNLSESETSQFPLILISGTNYPINVSKVQVYQPVPCVSNCGGIPGGGTGTPGQFFVTPSGNDMNDGKTISSAWASPNHTLNCSASGGDTIFVQPGTYTNFGAAPGSASLWGPTGTGCTSGTFRTVRCASGTADTTLGSCIITDGGSHIFPIAINTPYWIVKGFQVTCPSGFADTGAILANSGFAEISGLPPSSLAQGHHIVFMNNWVHDCARSGIYAGDYTAVIGLFAWNVGGSQYSDSGIDFYEPYPVDNGTGTRIFIAGAFILRTTPTSKATDSEGVFFGDWNWTQKGTPTCSGCTVSPVKYQGQGVVEQSVFLGNASSAFERYLGDTLNVYFNTSTTYGNNQNQQSCSNPSTEAYAAGPVNMSNDIIVEPAAAYTVFTNNSSNQCIVQNNNIPLVAIYSNFGQGTISNTDYVNLAVPAQNFTANTGPCCVITFNNSISVNPSFVNATVPTTMPSCSNSMTVVACMQTANIISNFTAQNSQVTGMGYQPPGPCTPDALFPTWIPITLIPSGLITTPCGTTSSYTGPGDIVAPSSWTAWYGVRAYSAATRGNKLMRVCDSTGSTHTETVGTGDGSTVQFSHTAGVLPILPGSASITWTRSGTRYTAYDDFWGSWRITSDVMRSAANVDNNNNIFYDSGAVTANFISANSGNQPPDSGTTLTLTYRSMADIACADMVSDVTTGDLVPIPAGTAGVSGGTFSVTCPDTIGSCTIQTAYDLTGHGNDVTNPTPGTRPALTAQAVPILGVKRACMFFFDKDHYLKSTATPAWGPAPISMSGVVVPQHSGFRATNEGAVNSVVLSSDGQAPSVQFQYPASSSGAPNMAPNNQMIMEVGSGSGTVSKVLEHEVHVFQAMVNAAGAANLHIDGVDHNITVGTTFDTTSHVNVSSPTYFNTLEGVLCETGYAGSGTDLSAKNSQMDSNQNAYYITPNYTPTKVVDNLVTFDEPGITAGSQFDLNMEKSLFADPMGYAAGTVQYFSNNNYVNNDSTQGPCSALFGSTTCIPALVYPGVTAPLVNTYMLSIQSATQANGTTGNVMQVIQPPGDTGGGINHYGAHQWALFFASGVIDVIDTEWDEYFVPGRYDFGVNSTVLAKFGVICSFKQNAFDFRTVAGYQQLWYYYAGNPGVNGNINIQEAGTIVGYSQGPGALYPLLSHGVWYHIHHQCAGPPNGWAKVWMNPIGQPVDEPFAQSRGNQWNNKAGTSINNAVGGWSEDVHYGGGFPSNTATFDSIELFDNIHIRGYKR